MATEQASLSRTTEGSEDQLNALVAVGGPLNGGKVRATKTALAFGPAVNEAALEAVEATYTGYPAGGVAIVWSSLGLSAEGYPTFASQRIRFQPTDMVTPNTLFAFWVAWQFAAGPPIVLHSELFAALATPQLQTSVLSFVDVTVYVQLRPDGVVGYIQADY